MDDQTERERALDHIARLRRAIEVPAVDPPPEPGGDGEV
jgi:hypothetical protein